MTKKFVLAFLFAGFGPLLAPETSLAKKGGTEKSKPAATKTRKPTQAGEVQVVPVSPDIDPTGYEEEGFSVLRPSDPSSPGEIPHPNVRDALFEKAGLTAQDLAGWDALDKDMLYLRARRYSVDELAALYPSISRKKLEKLRKLVNSN